MSSPRTTPPKPPASVEIPPALRARTETALRAAIPDATDVRCTITRRKTGPGARTTPWVLMIVVDHPRRNSGFDTGTTHVTSTGTLYNGNVYETPEKANEAAESVTAHWLQNRATEARRRSVSCAKEALVFEQRCLLEREESERLAGVLAAFREDPVLTADGADGQSPQTTTEPR